MTTVIWVVAAFVAFLVLVVILFYAYCLYHYSSVIDRIFAERPILIADHGEPLAGQQPITLETSSGRKVEASLIPSHQSPALGVILFLHEYGSTRWMAGPYAGYLLDAGFDLLTIDFSGSGQSPPIKGYDSLQWPTRYELEDGRAAIDYLRRHHPLGSRVGLMGVSKGGGVALALAAESNEVKGVVTDGAFPVRDMVVHYAMKWIEIYSSARAIYSRLPRWFYVTIVQLALARVEWKKRVRYLPIESAVRQRSSWAWLLIHGKNDNYIKLEVVERLFQAFQGQKDLWVVAKAKHNGCLAREGTNYHARVTAFFRSVFSERS